MGIKLLPLILLSGATLSAQSVPLTATATPTSVTFSYQIGATVPNAQTVAVKASIATPAPAYSVAVAGTNTLWLVVSPDSGKLPASLSLRVNPNSLAVGQYTATVNVTVVGVATPVAVPVTLNVTAPPSTLTASPSVLTFAAPPFPPPTQTISLSTSGTPISFTATAGSAWMTVSPTVGVALPGQQVALTVTVDPTGLAPQAAIYSGKITIAQGGTGAGAKTQNITVNLTVSSSQPTISSIFPPVLPINAGPQNITIRGSNFYSATTAKLQGGGTVLSTTVLSGTALLAVVPAAALTTPVTLNVIVSNPAPGGDSTPAGLTVGNIPTIQSVVNVASYGSASVSPGELVTIFGANLGPAIPAVMSVTNGFVDTTLAGVSVTVDNQPAPMLYASQNQVTIQVPYEATVGLNKAISLTNGANAPATANLTIAATAPGLFTLDGSGAGLAAALNFNATSGYSLNTASNPVKLGDTIILYLTGEGDYNPTLNPRTGLIVPPTLTPLPQVSPLPTVTIGGAAATVNYAGPLVGSILGLLQINAVVPAGATTGQAVPLVVTIGGNTTQGGVTLSVHP